MFYLCVKRRKQRENGQPPTFCPLNEHDAAIYTNCDHHYIVKLQSRNKSSAMRSGINCSIIPLSQETYLVSSVLQTALMQAMLIALHVTKTSICSLFFDV